MTLSPVLLHRRHLSVSSCCGDHGGGWRLRLRPQRLLAMRDAAQAHALLEAGIVHEKLILAA